MQNSTSSLTQKQDYRFLSLLCALYVTTLILTMVIENRIILIGSLKVLSGTLIIPISYAISDIITEVYGYKQMRKIIWVSMVCLYLSAAAVSLILLTPPDTSNTTYLAYATALQPFSKDILTYSVAALLSIFLNAYILSKWKIMVRGKYFWLRSLGSMAIGEAIFIITWAALGFRGAYPLDILLTFMLTSYTYKIVFNLFSIIPSSLAVFYLKRKENLDVYDTSTSFNPFSLKV